MYIKVKIAFVIDKNETKSSKSLNFLNYSCYLNASNDRSHFLLGFEYSLNELYLNAIFHYLMSLYSEGPYREITPSEIFRVFRECNTQYKSLDKQQSNRLVLLQYCIASIMGICILNKDLEQLANLKVSFYRNACAVSKAKEQKDDILKMVWIGFLMMNLLSLCCIFRSFAFMSLTCIWMMTRSDIYRIKNRTTLLSRSIWWSCRPGCTFMTIPKSFSVFPFCLWFSMRRSIWILNCFRIILFSRSSCWNLILKGMCRRLLP